MVEPPFLSEWFGGNISGKTLGSGADARQRPVRYT